jgi:hypothetical protein
MAVHEGCEDAEVTAKLVLAEFLINYLLYDAPQSRLHVDSLGLSALLGFNYTEIAQIDED